MQQQQHGSSLKSRDSLTHTPQVSLTPHSAHALSPHTSTTIQPKTQQAAGRARALLLPLRLPASPVLMAPTRLVAACLPAFAVQAAPSWSHHPTPHGSVSAPASQVCLLACSSDRAVVPVVVVARRERECVFLQSATRCSRAGVERLTGGLTG